MFKGKIPNSVATMLAIVAAAVSMSPLAPTMRHSTHILGPYTHPVVARTRGLQMAQWTAADMKAKRMRLPPEIDSILSADTSRENTEALWAALRSCFSSEDEAIAAATRNTGTILPYLNSPSNIYGNYDVLVDMLGREGARDVCAKNPGILQCNPKILAREDPDALVRAANQVDWFETGVLGSLPPPVRQNLVRAPASKLWIPS